MDLNVLLAETAPVSGSPTSGALTAARARLDDAASAASRRLLAVHVAKVRRRRRLLLATVAAAVALLLVPLVGRGPGAVPSAAAAEVMLAAAQAAGDQGSDWADAAYWHITLELDYPPTGKAPYRQELWLAHHGNGVIMSMDPEIPTGSDGVPLHSVAGPSTFIAGGTVDWDGLYALPTDPGALESVLRTGIRVDSTWDSDTQLWVAVTDLLRFSPASAALRRALWQVAATIPGVDMVGRTTDALGRPGVALERDMTDEGLYRARLVLDPGTGQILEELSYDSAGNVDYRMTTVDQGPADAAPAPDPPFCGPGSEPYRSC